MLSKPLPTFSALPAELVFEIARKLSDADLAAAARTSKRHYALLIPHIYRRDPMLACSSSAAPRYHAAATMLELGAYRPAKIADHPAFVHDLLLRIVENTQFDDVRHQMKRTWQYDPSEAHACRPHRTRIVEILFEKGAGWPEALIDLCRCTATWDCADLVALFVAPGTNIDINQQDADGMTALHHLVTRPATISDDFDYKDSPIAGVRPVTLYNFREMVGALVSQGARLDIKSKHGLTPLEQLHETWDRVMWHGIKRGFPVNRIMLWKIVALQTMLAGMSRAKANMLPRRQVRREVERVKTLRCQLGLVTRDLPLVVDGKRQIFAKDSLPTFNFGAGAEEETWAPSERDIEEDALWEPFLRGETQFVYCVDHAMDYGRVDPWPVVTL
ncbi:hypothetical protein QBC43DRAFT_288897 [Cladorrhinum sp. PSN259]|nr:hypothetical protein QBC43DRAFT_288897 [Cladorrhinum sp. PSN259]